MKSIFIALFTALLALLISACGLVGGSPTTSAQDVDALYTQAVQTMSVQLTADAMNALGTQVAAGSQPTQPVVLPADTATSVPASPTPQPTSTQAPTAMPTATATATPTAILPTPTFSSEDITLSLGSPTWRDNFDNEDNWQFSLYYKDPKKVSMEVKDGKAVLVAFNPDYYYEWLLTWPRPEDFYLEITATTGADCSGLDKYGLVFRSPDPTKGYLVGFTCDGRYSIWYFDGEKEVDIQNWKASDRIKQGANQTNRLGIKAEGNQLTVYANGVAIDTVSDTKESVGQFGLMVGSVKTENFTVYVDKLEFWDFTK